jgi:hypothetical protein
VLATKHYVAGSTPKITIAFGLVALPTNGVLTGVALAVYQPGTNFSAGQFQLPGDDGVCSATGQSQSRSPR